VTELNVAVPLFTRVIYGNGPPHHHGRWRH
jgi:hypothetical protein